MAPYACTPACLALGRGGDFPHLSRPCSPDKLIGKMHPSRGLYLSGAAKRNHSATSFARAPPVYRRTSNGPWYQTGIFQLVYQKAVACHDRCLEGSLPATFDAYHLARTAMFFIRMIANASLDCFKDVHTIPPVAEVQWRRTGGACVRSGTGCVLPWGPCYQYDAQTHDFANQIAIGFSLPIQMSNRFPHRLALGKSKVRRHVNERPAFIAQ